jgi:microcystin-dependent protein
MSQPYIGEVRLVGFNFAPYGWSICNGQTLSIAENPALFQLIGTTFGGDGQNTFVLPNLQGRIPIHQGFNGSNSYVPGQVGGVESVTILMGQFPSHSHALSAFNTPGASNSPSKNVVAQLANAYSNGAPTKAMNGAVLGPSGGGNQPHDNLQPYLALNWVIALNGVFPSPN